MKNRGQLIFILTVAFSAAVLGWLFLAPRPVRKAPPPEHKPRPVIVQKKLHEHGVHLAYEVYAAGFEALDATLEFGTDTKNYNVKVTAVTKGLIGRLFPWRTAAQTTGDVDAKGGLIPRKHVEGSQWRKHIYTELIEYDAAGVLQTRRLTDNGALMNSQPTDPKLAAGAGDILTATLGLLQHTTKMNACKGSYTVYDGRRRYDVTLADAGAAVLPKSRYSIFQGKTTRCTVKLVPVAGFTQSDKKRGWWAIQSYTEARGKPPTIWVAKAANGMDVIVRMEINSAYGAAVANLIGEKPY